MSTLLLAVYVALLVYAWRVGREERQRIDTAVWCSTNFARAELMAAMAPFARAAGASSDTFVIRVSEAMKGDE